jgi:HD superfamily phosphohydrolase YqeK
MDITTISIKYSRKINLGDYESAEAEAFYSAKVDDDESVVKCTAVLRDLAKQAVKDTLMDVVKSNEHQLQKAQVTRQLMGKPLETTSFN